MTCSWTGSPNNPKKWHFVIKFVISWTSSWPAHELVHQRTCSWLQSTGNMAIFSRISPKNLEFHLKFPVLFCVTWFFFFKAMDKTQTIRQLGQFFLFFSPNFYHYNDIVSVVPLIFFHVSTNVYEGCVRSTPENEKIKFWTRLLKATVDTVGGGIRSEAGDTKTTTPLTYPRYVRRDLF